ncbi:MAG TPA: adenylate/guanylate cyclase domain-containing protein [Gaiellaceae bacterium]|nr:adenylate/guanylate cyclase domain-containing protein [Gaiellaceae bacterium]
MDGEIHYVRNSGVAIAYQIVGDGPTDLVFVPEFTSNLVYGWEHPYWREFYERLAGSFRLILYDKRGTGLSDHGGQFPSLETRMDDLRAVLEAAESPAACVLGSHDGCSMAALYAATYPERTRALVLFQPWAYMGMTDDDLASLADLRERWGTAEYSDQLLATICPTLFASEAGREWFANECRVGATPAVAYALNLASYQTDLRDVLPAIRVSTLVLHRGAEGAEGAQGVVARIPEARSAALAGEDWWGIFLSPELVAEVERFVAGQAPPEVPETVLATLLFTDIVGSTTKAAELGDQRWRELLGRHHALVRRELARFRGVERDTAGDGFFATFDGPARAIRCAQVVARDVRELGLEIRAGVHTGECELHDDKVAGIAVSIGARVAAQADPGEVLVTGTVKDLVAGSGLVFAPRGDRELKGVPGTWPIYAVAEG